jgi:prefoldin subunit 5
MNEKEARKKGNVTVDCGTNLAIAKDNDEAEENYLKLLV